MLYASPLIIGLCTLLAALVGACVGSFVNCASLRRDTQESVLEGRSHCPYCKKTLSALELVPIVSYLVQKGRCRSCGHALPRRYVVTEALCGIVFAAIVWTTAHSLMGLSLLTVQYLAFAAILLYASLVDIDTRTIPNGCIIAAIVVRVVYIVLAGPALGLIDTSAVVRESLIGAVAVTVPLTAIVWVTDHVLGRESMGGGDLKLFFCAGLYFGWRQCLFLIMIACILGIVGSLIATKGGEGAPLRGRLITFGPYIASACVITMLVGAPLVWWYEGLF